MNKAFFLISSRHRPRTSWLDFAKLGLAVAFIGFLASSALTYAQSQSGYEDLFANQSSSSSFGGSGSNGFGEAILPRKTWGYNFDDASSPNDFPLRYWVRMESDPSLLGAPFPTIWNGTKYIPPAPIPGQEIPRVLSMYTRGGNVGIQVVDGVIPAVPLIDYMIRLKLRTVNCKRAKARVAARFLDQQGKPIQGSETFTKPLQTDDEWQTIALPLKGRYLRAAWIQIDLTLLQESVWNGHPAVGQEVFLEDVNGSVEFDDLTVWRLPRIELQLNAANVVVEPDPISISVFLQDLAKEQLVGHMQIFDIEGQLQDSIELPLNGSSVRTIWEPQISGFGWYHTTLEVREAGKLIAQSSLDFAYVPHPVRDAPTNGAITEFTTILENMPHDRTLEALGSLLDHLQADRVVLPIWEPDLTLGNLEEYQSRLYRSIDVASRRSRVIDFILSQLPIELANKLGHRPDLIVGALAQGGLITPQYLDDFLIRFGQRADRWLIGRPDSSEFVRRSDLAEVIEAIDTRIAMYVAQPNVQFAYPGIHETPDLESLFTNLSLQRSKEDRAKLSVNGSASPSSTQAVPANTRAERAEQALLASRAAAQLVRHSWMQLLPPSIHDEGISQLLAPRFNEQTASLNDSEGGDKSASKPSKITFIEPISIDQYGELASAQDLAKRAILSREAGARELAIDQPWANIGLLRPRPMPTPHYPVWRTMREMLAFRTAAGRMNLASDLVAIIFIDDDGEEGTIALWNTSNITKTVTLSVNLGLEDVSMVDIFGNRTAVPFQDGKHEFTVGHEPVFLENIDAYLAVFRARFKLEPRFVEAAAVDDPHELSLYNPWKETLQGTIRLTSPEGWIYKPRFRTFTIPSGAERRFPVSLTIPLFATAGKKVIGANVSIEAPRQVTIDAAFPVDLGFNDIIVRPRYTFVPNPRTGVEDLLIQVEVINTSNEMVNIKIFSVAPKGTGAGLKYAIAPSIEPNSTVERAFYYAGPAENFIGKTFRVGFSALDSSDRLNLLLEIE